LEGSAENLYVNGVDPTPFQYQRKKDKEDGAGMGGYAGGAAAAAAAAAVPLFGLGGLARPKKIRALPQVCACVAMCESLCAPC